MLTFQAWAEAWAASRDEADPDALWTDENLEKSKEAGLSRLSEIEPVVAWWKDRLREDPASVYLLHALTVNTAKLHSNAERGEEIDEPLMNILEIVLAVYSVGLARGWNEGEPNPCGNDG